MFFRWPVALLCAAVLAPRLGATTPHGRVSVAAAANLTYAVKALDAEFVRVAPDVRVTATVGASGSLFAQIAHGAPFDVFLSADLVYPQKLVTSGLGDAGTMRTFATGRLVVWTTNPALDLTDLAALLRSPAVRKIAIAQPSTAPFGRAAEDVLRALQVGDDVRAKLVVGENIAQTAQFVETGNADAGFVAQSLVTALPGGARGRWREVDPALYAGVSLAHGCVLTTRGARNEAARAYLAFLTSPTARKILEAQGYTVPSPARRQTPDH